MAETEVWSSDGALRDLHRRRAIVADIVSGMPNYAVAPYFEEKENIFNECDILVVGDEVETGTHVGLLAAKEMKTADGLCFLFIQTLLIAERFQRSSLIIKLYRELFKCILARGEVAPEVIAFRTYNPQSFVAMAVFARIPDVEMYPAVDDGVQADHLQRMACDVAEAVSPGCPFDPSTGTIKGAAQGRSREFYRKMPSTSKRKVHYYFEKNLEPADRVLCCIIFNTGESKRRMLRLFGVQPSGD